MINIIWFLILSLGIIVGIVTGKGETVSKAVVSSTTGSVELVMGLVGMMCLWCGIMKIAEKSGLTDKLAKVLGPILKIFFKETGKNQKAMNKKLDKMESLIRNDLPKKINALNDTTNEDLKELNEIAMAVRKKSKHLN